MYGFPTDEAMNCFIELAKDSSTKARNDEKEENALAWIGLLDGFFLEKLIARYDQGEKEALLHIINHCIWAKIDVPERFADAFGEAVFKWQKAEVPSLDKAFDVERPKGEHINARKKKLRLMRRVHLAVETLHKEGRPINKILYQEVGEQFHIGGTLAENYHKESKNTDAAVDKLTDDVLKSRVFKLREDDEYKNWVQAISKIPQKK
ncbi:MAG: hypothetical protein Q7U57_07625 [Methylovulum sp.]|nr:hypothetical protein [Methylovulum sp.]